MDKLLTITAPLLLLLLTSCGSSSVVNPFTSGAAAVLGAYELTQRRDKLEEYANNGDVYSQYELGQSYCCNRREGVLDAMASIEWFCYAARNGHVEAQRVVGDIYAGKMEITDLAITPNYTQAYGWYSLAAKRYDHTAKERLQELEATLEIDSLYEARTNVINNARHATCGDDMVFNM